MLDYYNWPSITPLACWFVEPIFDVPSTAHAQMVPSQAKSRTAYLESMAAIGSDPLNNIN